MTMLEWLLRVAAIAAAVGIPSCFGQGWTEDFESYTQNAFPRNWQASGNTDTHVDAAVAASGRQSVRLVGRVGQCWAALIHRQVNTQAPYTLSYSVRNGNEALSGCHPNRAVIGMRSSPDWRDTNWRGFGRFDRDGAFRGDGLPFVSEPYPLLSWVRVQVSYERPTAATVRISYWVNGRFFGMVEEAAPAGEDQRTWLELNADEGTVWYDDVSVTPGSPPYSASPCSVTLNPATRAINSAGGAVTFAVAPYGANCAWTASSDSGWASVAAPGAGTGNGVLTVNIAPNDGVDARTAVIRIGEGTARIEQAGRIPWRPVPDALIFRFVKGTGAPAAQGLGLWTGGPSMPYSLTLETDSGAWLGVDATSGAMPRANRVTVSGTLEPGVYRGRVVVKVPLGSPAEQAVPVTVVVEEPGRYVLETAAGRGDPGPGPSPAANWSLTSIASIGTDSSGNVYMLDTTRVRILKLSPEKMLSVMWSRTQAWEEAPFAAAGGPSGEVYLATQFKVFRVTGPASTTVVAGGGYQDGEGISAASARISPTTSLAVDGDGNLFVGEMYRIRKISKDGLIRTVAGGGSGMVEDGVPATSVYLSHDAIAADRSGNLYIRYGQSVSRVSPDGRIWKHASTAGNGEAIAAAPDGVLYAAAGQALKRIPAPNQVAAFAGGATAGFSGDGGPATSAQFNGIAALAADAGGNVYVLDAGNFRLRKIAPGGTITTVAGGGSTAREGSGPDLNLNNINDLVPAPGGGLYFLGTDIRRLDPDGSVRLVTELPDLGGGLRRQLTSIAATETGDLLATDSRTVMRITQAGYVTVAGQGNQAPEDGKKASEVAFWDGISKISAGSNGDILVGSNRIWKIRSDDTLALVAGNGSFSTSVIEGALAVNSPIPRPENLLCGPDGSVYFVGQNRVYLIAPDGRIRTFAGGGTLAPQDGLPATAISLSASPGLAIDLEGQVLVAGADRIVKVAPDGSIRVIDSSKLAGTEKSIGVPRRILASATGRIYYSDGNYDRVKVLIPASGCPSVLSTDRMEIPAAGGSVSVNVDAYASCGWSINGAPSWLAVTSGPAGTGSATVEIRASANPGEAPRVLTLLVAGKPLTVYQYGTSVPPAFGAAAAVSPATLQSLAAPNSRLSITGRGLALAEETAGDRTLSELAGTAVEMNGHKALLVSVSPDRVVCVVPIATSLGEAQVSVKIFGVQVASGSVSVALVAPGIPTVGDGPAGDVENAVNAWAPSPAPFPAETRYSSQDSRTRVRMIVTGVRYADGRAPDEASTDVSSRLRVEATNSAGRPLFLAVERAVPATGYLGGDWVMVILPIEAGWTDAVTFRIWAGTAASNWARLRMIQEPAPALSAVSAGSYFSPVAPDSLISVFGSAMAAQTAIATLQADGQLPVELAGARIEINGRPAPLIFVSPAQINCLVPSQTETGTARMVLKVSGTEQATSKVTVVPASPSLFTADGSGSGTAAAFNAVTYAGPPFTVETPEIPGADKRTRVALFGTGIRWGGNPSRDASKTNAAAAVQIEATDAAGRSLPVAIEYAGAAPGFFGLD